MPQITTLQILMLPHQYGDTISDWARFRQRHHENFLHAGRLHNLICERINEVKGLAMACTEDRETRVALKKCAKEFKKLVGKKTEWW